MSDPVKKKLTRCHVCRRVFDDNERFIRTKVFIRGIAFVHAAPGRARNWCRTCFATQTRVNLTSENAGEKTPLLKSGDKIIGHIQPEKKCDCGKPLDGSNDKGMCFDCFSGWEVYRDAAREEALNAERWR